MTKIRFKGIMFCLELDHNIRQFLHIFENACKSLNNIGQQNPKYNIFIAIFFEEKWPLHA